MWLSHRMAMQRVSAAEVGAVTIGGEASAVMTDSEHRDLAVFSPGGYFWRPKVGENVLVIKCGENEMCILGENAGDELELEPGEVYIKSDAASVHVRNDGSIRLAGRIEIDGGLYLNGNEIV